MAFPQLSNIKSIFSKYNFAKFMVFVLTFISYAFLHANRKSFSNVKPTLKRVWTPQLSNSSEFPLFPKSTWRSHNLFKSENSAEDYLGVLDGVFMGSYAVGLYVNGYLGDLFSPRLVLGTGMSMSAVVIFVFGVVTEWTHFYNVYFYGFIYVLNGLCQSTGWPAAVAIMGNWFGSNRGFYMGAWSSCASVGNIIGDYLTGLVVDTGYEYGFLVPAVMLFSGGGLILAGILESPEELGSLRRGKMYETLQTEETEEDEQLESVCVKIEDGVSHKLSICEIIMIPGVIYYSLAYACLKLVNYAFFFWLSMYMTNVFKWSNSFADDISVWYDVGGIIGGIIMGLISDWMWSRSPIVELSLLLTIPALFIYRQTPGSPVNTNIAVLAITGFFIGGPANLISSAISADLGSRPLLSGNTAALSTVTGIVDGTGSIGAAIGQVCVPVIAHKYGWQAVFIFFMLMISCTFLCIFPILVLDIIRLIRVYRDRRRDNDADSLVPSDDSSHIPQQS